MVWFVLPGWFYYHYPTIVAGPPNPFIPMRGAGFFTIGLQSVAVMLLFVFGDHLSMPPFSFCVADSTASQRPGASSTISRAIRLIPPK